MRTLLDTVGDVLANAFEPLHGRLEGISNHEYLWEPAQPSWSLRLTDDGWQADGTDDEPADPVVPTIAWRMWHVAVDALDSYSIRLFGRVGAGYSGRAFTPDAAGATAALDSAWDVFRSGMAEWNEPHLMSSLGSAWGPFAQHTHLDLVHHAAREVIHHFAEIALLRDLYAASWRTSGS